MKIPNLFTLVLFAAITAHAEVFIFDFGTKDSPLHTHALRVTPEKTAASQWRTSGGIEAHATPVVRDWTAEKHSGKKSPPPVYLNELTCDHINGNGAAALDLPTMPDGDYTLLLLCGHAGGRTEQVWDITVECDGAKAAATFAGPHELRALRLSVTARAGKGLALNFTTRSRWLVNTLIAVPATERDTAKKNVIDPLLDECFLLPPEELAKWKETPHPRSTPEPQWTDKHTRDGLAVFTRPWCDPIWPDEYPRLHEIDAPVRAFASPGEHEPLTFALYPLKEFANANVQICGPLVCTNGAKRISIESSAIDVRVVRYMNVRPNYSAFNTYYRAPDVLMPWQAQPLRKGENTRVWLTVKVPLAQPEGLYEGNAIVKADSLIIRVPISLRVLPITLQKDQSLVYGQYYHHPFRNLDNAPDDFSRTWWQRKAEAEHADMLEHGMNTVVLNLGGTWKKDRWVFAFDRLQRDIDLFRRVGFNKPVVCSFPCSGLYHKHMKSGMGAHLGQISMPPDAFFEELTAMVSSIETEARRRQWPELLYYPVDEPSTSPDSVAFMVRVMKAIKRVPKIRTYITADPAFEQFAALRPYIDVWCSQPFSLGHATIQADMEARGVEYWCYPNHISGENDHTPTIGARMTYGYGFWRSGYRSLIPWIYQASNGDPWNNLDGATQDFCNRTADDGTPIPVTLWEAYREGIDDHRYLYTLENTIARAEAAGFSDSAAQARKVIEHLTNAIAIQPKYKDDGLWSAEAFDAWRWAIAEQIIRLQALLDQ